MDVARLLRLLGESRAEVVCGDPTAFAVRSVEQLRAGRVPPRDALLLVGARADLDGLARLGPRPILAAAEHLADAPDEVARLEEAGAVVVAWPEPIPLDLAARVQRRLAPTHDAGLPGDAIARARQDLVEDVVLGRYRDPEANLRRARALGIELQSLHAVLLVGFVDFERFYVQHEARGELFFQRLKGQMLTTARREATRQQPNATVVPHGEGALVLVERDPDAVGAELARTLRHELRLVPLVVAGGAPGDGADGLMRSYGEAQGALQLRKRLRLRERYVAFRDLTGFALLQRVERSSELSPLLAAELAPLLDAEYGRKPVLVETLAAYYDAGSSLKAAAEAIGIHPKTLRYRLDRIDEILGEGTVAGEKRLLLHLAAKVHLWRQG
ncbi:MAG: helix-turn-helix domain-containing protein [Acidimicrobiia bacterium]